MGRASFFVTQKQHITKLWKFIACIFFYQRNKLTSKYTTIKCCDITKFKILELLSDSLKTQFCKKGMFTFTVQVFFQGIYILFR